MCFPQLVHSRLTQGVAPRDPEYGARIKQVVGHPRLPRGTPLFADRCGQVCPRRNRNRTPERAEDVGEGFGAVRLGDAGAGRRPVPILDDSLAGLAEPNPGRSARIDLDDPGCFKNGCHIPSDCPSWSTVRLEVTVQRPPHSRGVMNGSDLDPVSMRQQAHGALQAGPGDVGSSLLSSEQQYQGTFREFPDFERRSSRNGMQNRPRRDQLSNGRFDDPTTTIREIFRCRDHLVVSVGVHPAFRLNTLRWRWGEDKFSRTATPTRTTSGRWPRSCARGTGGNGPRAGFVTASREVLPEFREYERFNTTALNAYIGPLIDGYLARLQAAVAARGYRSPVFIMTSNGGVATPPRSRRSGSEHEGYRIAARVAGLRIRNGRHRRRTVSARCRVAALRLWPVDGNDEIL